MMKSGKGRPMSAQMRPGSAGGFDKKARPQSAAATRDSGTGGLPQVGRPRSPMEGEYEFGWRALQQSQWQILPWIFMAPTCSPDSPRLKGAKPVGGILQNTGIYADAHKATVMTEEMRIKYLTEQLYDTKRDINLIKSKHVKLIARQKCVERELARRDRLLKQIVESNKNGTPLSSAILLALKQTCQNQLPLYKRKRIELEETLQERDQKISTLKKEPLFTKIVELEAILTCYQNELQRLESMQQEGETSELAQEEMHAMQQLVEVKTEELEKLSQAKSRVDSEQSEMEDEFNELNDEYNTVESELKAKHSEVKAMYERFKTRLEDVKRKEQMKIDLNIMDEKNRKVRDEIARLRKQTEAHLKVNNAISKSIFQDSAVLPEPAQDLLYRVRRRCQARAREKPEAPNLLQLFEKCETYDAGTISAKDMYQVFERIGARMSTQDFDALIYAFPRSGTFPSDTDKFSVLDVVTLIGSELGTAGEAEDEFFASITDADVEETRMAFRKMGIPYKDFRNQMLTAETYAEMVRLFESVMPGKESAKKWLQIWELFGAGLVCCRIHSWPIEHKR